MAWHIEEHVVRGEIDNRTRGTVTGKIWFAGRPDPVELTLSGNAAPDLAGRRLEFVNPSPQPGLPDSFAAKQEGTAGDLTASRKVRLPDLLFDPIDENDAANEPFPEPRGNALHLEWFSRANGHVVIESAWFELGMIVDEPAWEMTAEEHDRQRQISAEALNAFPDPFDEFFDEEDPCRDKADGEASTDWDETPPTEEEAEQLQARNDLLIDRIQARLAREGPDADYTQILHEEIDRLRRELGEPEPEEDFSQERAAWIKAANEAAEEAFNDPDVLAESELEHPLVAQAYEFAQQLMATSDELGWVPKNAGEEHPVADMIAAAMKASAKLGGALNGYEWPPDRMFCASTIVSLKRARVYLDDALRATESCQEQKLIEPVHLGPILVELIDLAHEADELIEELREQLNPADE